MCFCTNKNEIKMFWHVLIPLINISFSQWYLLISIPHKLTMYRCHLFWELHILWHKDTKKPHTHAANRDLPAQSLCANTNHLEISLLRCANKQCVTLLNYSMYSALNTSSFLTHSNYLQVFTWRHEERFLARRHLFTTNHRDWACEC